MNGFVPVEPGFFDTKNSQNLASGVGESKDR